MNRCLDCGDPLPEGKSGVVCQPCVEVAAFFRSIRPRGPNTRVVSVEVAAKERARGDRYRDRALALVKAMRRLRKKEGGR